MKIKKRFFLILFLFSFVSEYAQNMYYSSDFFEKKKAAAILNLQKFSKEDTLRIIVVR